MKGLVPPSIYDRNSVSKGQKSQETTVVWIEGGWGEVNHGTTRLEIHRRSVPGNFSRKRNMENMKVPLAPVDTGTFLSKEGTNNTLSPSH